MTPVDLLWIFFVFSAVQPAIQQRMLDARRLRILSQLGRTRKSRAIALVHREETMNLLGFPVMRYISVNDSEQILRAVKLSDPDGPIDLIVHTPGGLVLASAQIAHALRHHRGKVTVFVPHYAMSGGTLIALAADEIVMDENAVLGPIDPQVGKSPAASILAVLQQKKPEDIDDQTLILADISRKAIAQVTSFTRDLLTRRLAPDAAQSLASQLTAGTWTHDYPITATQARSLGLPVSVEMPREVYDFLSLFPQPTRARPAVEYAPAPVRAGSREQRTVD